MNWKFKFWKKRLCFNAETYSEMTSIDNLRHSENSTESKILNSNLRHLEFIDFYEDHLRSRKQTDFIRDQLESLEYLKNNIKDELVSFYSQKPNC